MECKQNVVVSSIADRACACAHTPIGALLFTSGSCRLELTSMSGMIHGQHAAVLARKHS